MRLLALLAAGLFAGSLFAADDKKDKPMDEDAIVGVWSVEKLDDGSGKEPPAEQLAKIRLTFDKGGKVVIRQTQGGESTMSYKLDPAAKPKAIDLTELGNSKAGIYELDGDSLKVCHSKDKTRPTEFKADGKGVVVLTLKRVKEEKKDK